MKCTDVSPNLAAFVVGGLDPEEAAAIRRVDLRQLVTNGGRRGRDQPRSR